MALVTFGVKLNKGISSNCNIIYIIEGIILFFL